MISNLLEDTRKIIIIAHLAAHFVAKLYEINSENKIKISGNTQSLDYGSYSMKVRLVSGIEKKFSWRNNCRFNSFKF